MAMQSLQKIPTKAKRSDLAEAGGPGLVLCPKQEPKIPNTQQHQQELVRTACRDSLYV